MWEFGESRRRSIVGRFAREIISSAATACVWRAASHESPKYQSRRIPAAPGRGPAWYYCSFHDSESRRPRPSGRAARTRSIRHLQPCAVTAACGGEESAARPPRGRSRSLFLASGRGGLYLCRKRTVFRRFCDAELAYRRHESAGARQAQRKYRPCHFISLVVVEPAVSASVLGR